MPQITTNAIEKSCFPSVRREAARKARDLTRRKSALDGMSCLENWQTAPTRIRKTVRSSWSREIPRAVPQNPREAVQRRRSCLCVEKS